MIDYQRQAQMCSKCTKIIADLSEMYGISLERAMDMFYHNSLKKRWLICIVEAINISLLWCGTKHMSKAICIERHI